MNCQIAQTLHNCVKGRCRGGITKVVGVLTVLMKGQRQCRHRWPNRCPRRAPRCSTKTRCQRDFVANIAPKPACGASSACSKADYATKWSIKYRRKFSIRTTPASCCPIFRIWSSSGPCGCKSISTISRSACDVSRLKFTPARCRRPSRGRSMNKSLADRNRALGSSVRVVVR